MVFVLSANGRIQHQEFFFKGSSGVQVHGPCWGCHQKSLTAVGMAKISESRESGHMDKGLFFTIVKGKPKENLPGLVCRSKDPLHGMTIGDHHDHH